MNFIPLELLILLSMLVTFVLGVFLLKLPAGISLILGAITGSIVGGEGIPLRHLVEGSIAFIDPILIVITAMIFMKVVEETGALASINFSLIKSMYKYPTILIILITFFVMLPGTLTGISSTCILTTGVLVAPALLAMGMPKQAVGALISVAAVFGMIAPPINLPIMIIGGGVDMPYIGFDIPLLLIILPLAVITAVYFRFKYLREFDIKEVLLKLPPSESKKYGLKLFIPLILVILILVSTRIFSNILPDIGIPLIFILGIISSFYTGNKFNLIDLSRRALRESLPILIILVGVGMFVQIMTLTGVRGFIALNAIELPAVFLYCGIALIMPAFGSAFASSSVLGVPLIFVFLNTDVIIVASVLSLIAGLGDLMPPPSLLPVFASQIVDEKNHFTILKTAAPIILLSLVFSIVILIFAKNFGSIINVY